MPIYKEINTKQNLLEAAIKRFAVHGFEGTSIRDVVKDAEATLSSVSYHFGGKEELYISAIEYVLEEKSGVKRLFCNIDTNLHDREQIIELVNQNIRRVFELFHEREKSGMSGKLLSRSMLESRKVVIELFRNYFEPVEERLKVIIRYFNPQVNDEEAFIVIHNLWGQINFYSLAKAFIINAHDKTEYTPEFFDHVSRSITRNLVQGLL